MSATVTGDLPGRKLSLSHLGISCLDHEAMIRFYTEVMGMTLADRGDVHGVFRIAFLTTDPRDHHQLVLASGRTDTVIETGPVFGGHVGSRVFQISFRLDSLATMRRMVERIRGAGVDTFTPLNHGNAWAVYSRDIEGNAIELFVDTPWQVAQPCGLPLDLAKTDDEIVAETEAYCRAQPECTPYQAWSDEMAATIVANQAAL